jgi:hypothetical protein
MTHEDSHVIMRIKLAPEIGKWRVTKRFDHVDRMFEAEFSLRGDGALIRRTCSDGELWSAYEYFATAGWTIDTTIAFLNNAYPNVTLA